MKKRFTIMIAAIIMLLTMLTLPGKVWATDYSYTFTSQQYSAAGAVTLNNVSWTMAGTGGSYFGYDGTKGQQFGSGSKPYSAVSLTTSGISGTITSVAVNTSGANSISGTVAVSVGETAFTYNNKTTASLTSTATSYTFTNTGASGNVVISWAQTSSKAIYVKSITVTYSTGGGGGGTTYTVTYNANGGIGTMTDENSPYDEGSTVTVLNNTFGRCGYDFQNWNTEANASGTDYDEGDEFEIGNAITLYAQWTAQTGITIATLTQSNLELTGSYTTNTEKTIDGITYVYTDLMKSTDYIQAKASSGTIKNSTAYSGDIKCVAIKHNGDARATTINGSSDGTVWHQVATGSGSIFADFSGKGYKYFQITRGSNAAYWTKIEIAYLTTPSITAENVNIAYGATGGSIGYTINNPSTPEGTLSAAIAQSPTSTIEGLTIGTINASTVAFTCAANNTTTARTATVTLTYTYGNSQTATKDVVITQAAAPTPTISAADVDLEYDDEDGSISYTLNNPQTGGAVTAEITAGNTGNWLSIGDPSNSNASGTVALTCVVNPGAQRTATVTLTYTYNTKATIEEEVTVTQAVNPTYVPTITEVRAQGTGSVHTRGVVTSVNGKTAYIQDSGAAMAVYDSSADLVVSVGDQIDVTGTLGTYNGLLQIQSPTVSVLSNGNTVEPEVMTIAQVNASTKQGWLVKIEGATVSAINSQNVTIAQNSNSVVVRFNSTSDITFEQNDVITLTGNIGCYNTVQIANPTDITVQHLPAISVNPASLAGFTYVVGNGPSTTKTVSVTGAYLTADITLSLGNNSDFEMSTTEGSGYTNSLTLTPSEGSVATTTVYVRLKSGLAVGNSYSGTITLSSTDAANKTVSLSGSVTEPVVDYADLTTGPFKYTGNGTGTLPVGLSKTGTGTYPNQPKIKFDNTNDNVILKTGSAPGAIVFDIAGKFSSGTWTGTFDLQTSEDGTNYSNLAEFTSLSGETQTVFFTNTNPSVRYIKWVFTSKTSGYNVAIGNIIVTAEQSITNGTSTFTPEANHVYVVNSGATLILDGDYSETLTDATKLIIEDGGQLVISNDVAATVKKDIDKYDNATDKDGWYTIASPAAGANVSLAQLGTYDLFAYDEEHHQWLNVKDGDNNITTFAQGQGFLYANSANQTLPFAGTMKASNATVTVQLSYESADGKLKGFNLVGNPFTCNVTSGMVTMNGEALTTYYVAEGGSNLVTRNLANTPIKPGRGFFVQAPSGCDLVFNPGAKGEMDYKPTFISIEAGNGEFADRAYVQLGYGNTLRKMSINDNTPMVYVMNNDADYAAATVNALKGTMPVCFRAKETGHYTISVATEGLDMSYLHLIDRLTGADIDLLIEPSYSFIATKDDNQSRFILSFTADCFNEDEDEIFAYQNGNEIFVNGEGELQVFDVMGHMVATQRINGVETVNIPAQGVYIMRLNEKTQKIVVR